MTRVIFHATCKIAGFTGSNGVDIVDMLPGDNFSMPEFDAKRLEDAGAGRIRREPIAEFEARFQRASDLSVITDGMERETDAINKLDREVKNP